MSENYNDVSMMITDADKDQLNYVYSVVIFSQSQVGASSGFNRKNGAGFARFYSQLEGVL